MIYWKHFGRESAASPHSHPFHTSAYVFLLFWIFAVNRRIPQSYKWNRIRVFVFFVFAWRIIMDRSWNGANKSHPPKHISLYGSFFTNILLERVFFMFLMSNVVERMSNESLSSVFLFSSHVPFPFIRVICVFSLPQRPARHPQFLPADSGTLSNGFSIRKVVFLSLIEGEKVNFSSPREQFSLFGEEPVVFNERLSFRFYAHYFYRQLSLEKVGILPMIDFGIAGYTTTDRPSFVPPRVIPKGAKAPTGTQKNHCERTDDRGRPLFAAMVSLDIRSRLHWYSPLTISGWDEIQSGF